MFINITRADAKQTLQSYRKAGIKSNTFTDIAESRAERKEIQMLSDTLSTFTGDNPAQK